MRTHAENMLWAIMLSVIIFLAGRTTVTFRGLPESLGFGFVYGIALLPIGIAMTFWFTDVMRHSHGTSKTCTECGC